MYESEAPQSMLKNTAFTLDDAHNRASRVWRIINIIITIMGVLWLLDLFGDLCDLKRQLHYYCSCSWGFL